MKEQFLLFFITIGLTIFEYSLFSSNYFFLGYFGTLAIALALFANKKFDRRFTTFLTVMVVVLGPYGSGMTATAIILYLVYCKSSTSIADLLSALFPEQESDTSRDLYERVLYSLEDLNSENDIIPFNDVISFGTEKQKRRAIEKILRYYHPKFIPVLRKALSDRHPGIRVLAATAIAALNDQYFQKYLELEEEVRANGGPESRFKLAKHCARYVESEIPDEDRKRRMRQKAIQFFESYLESVPSDSDVLLELGKLYLGNGDFEQATHYLEKAIENNQTQEACKWYMSALFELKQFDKLRSFAKDQYLRVIRSNQWELNVEVMDLLTLWRGQVLEVSHGQG